MTYSYDPLQINSFGKDKMRFELGDTFVEGGHDTSVLSDEEYNAVTSDILNIKMWQKAKLRLLEAILFKLSYQTDTKIDVLSYSFGSRAEHFKKLYDSLKSETLKNSTPVMSSDLANKPPYFYTGMGGNTEALL